MRTILSAEASLTVFEFETGRSHFLLSIQGEVETPRKRNLTMPRKTGAHRNSLKARGAQKM